MIKKIVGFDVSPLYSGHSVRGVGFYTQRLLTALKELKSKEFVIKELKSKVEIKKGNFDILHIPYFSPFFLTLPIIKNKPLIVTIHDLIPVKYPLLYPTGIKARINWQLQKLLLKQVNLVITDSFASKYDISSFTNFPQDRIFVTYLAAGEEFKVVKNKKPLEKIRRQYKLPKEFCLYVGDVNRNKNLLSLVAACQKLKLTLVIVGKQAASDDFDAGHPENIDLKILREVIDLNPKQIRTLGFVETRDLVGIYNLASVYCQPSIDEGFGLPVVEAMACGCPIVSGSGGSLPEVVGEGGFLVDDPFENQLAGAIKKVMQDRNLQKELIKKGLKRSKEFSWQETAKKTIEAYRQV